MPTNKDRRPRTVRSRLLALKRAEIVLHGCREILDDAKSWLIRADRIGPEAVNKLIKETEKTRRKADSTLVAQQKTASLFPLRQIPMEIDWSAITGDSNDDCPVISGVSQARISTRGTPIDLPGDSDTEWGYDAALYDPPTGSYHSLMYKHWIRDKTHWYSADMVDMLWVLSHLGYEIPAPQCKGTIHYEANISVLVSAFTSAEISLLSDELLVQETPDAVADNLPPRTYEAYKKSYGQLNFTSTEFKTLDASVTGSYRVKKGKKSRVWFGISGICSALDGFAGTNGYCYLMVKPVSGETKPGVKYAFVPD